MGRARTKQFRSDAAECLPFEVPASAPSPAPAPPKDVPASGQPGNLVPPPIIDDQDFEQGFGEPLDRTLDLDTWQSGLYLCGDWERIERELGEALEQKQRNVQPIRNRWFPLIASRPNAPKGADVFQATIEQLRATQANVLFNGGVEACDGTCAVHGRRACGHFTKRAG